MLYFCMDNFLIVPRQILAILLLLSFAYRPVFQIGEISYYQFNLDYIIKSYCINKNKPALHCNGKCYLMQQLEKSNNLGNSKASVNIAASFLPAYFHIPPDYQLIHTFFYVEIGECCFRKHFKDNPFFPEIEHPPSYS